MIDLEGIVFCILKHRAASCSRRQQKVRKICRGDAAHRALDPGQRAGQVAANEFEQYLRDLTEIRNNNPPALFGSSGRGLASGVMMVTARRARVAATCRL